MNDSFRGHLQECIRHFAARFTEAYPKGSRESAERKRPIAEFCGVNIHTVTDWFFRADNVPVGDRYLKLLCFLDLNGYKVIEFERFSLKCKNFTRLIGFGVIKSEDAAVMLGYSNVSELFRVLRGISGSSKDREEKMWDMWKVRKDELDAKIEEAAAKYRLRFTPSQSSFPATREPQRDLHSSPQRACPKDGVVDVMKGLLKLLNSGVFDNLSDADWAAVRESGGTILELSSHLSTLSARLVKPS